MAVNHADGTLFVSVAFYPLAAAAAATTVGAKWFAVLFIPLGLASGLIVTFAARRLLRAGMHRVVERNPESRSRPSWLAGGLLLIAYLAFPYLVIGIGLYLTWHGSIWLVQAAT